VGKLVGERWGGGRKGLVEDRYGYSEKGLLVYFAQEGRWVKYVTLCFEACIGEIDWFGLSSSDLELWLDKVLFLLFLGFGRFAHDCWLGVAVLRESHVFS
jgi:hypothetical protein